MMQIVVDRPMEEWKSWGRSPDWKVTSGLAQVAPTTVTIHAHDLTLAEVKELIGKLEGVLDDH